MKQISKSEYANYVEQQSTENADLLDSTLPKLTSSSQETDNSDSILNSFYSFDHSSSSTKSVNSQQQQQQQQLQNEEFLLKDLSAGHDLLNSLDNTDESEDLFETADASSSKQRRALAVSSQDESVHYITLSSSPLISEQMLRERNVFVSTLTIRQVTGKDSGVYVCFGANSKGYNYRKATLAVLPPDPNSAPPPAQTTTSPISAVLDLDLARLKQLQQLMQLQNKKISLTTKKPAAAQDENSFSLINSLHSVGFLIILIPVMLISSFALAAMCHLIRSDAKLKKNQKSSCFINCCQKSSASARTSSSSSNDSYSTSSSSKSAACFPCLPSSSPSASAPSDHSFIHSHVQYETDDLTMSNKNNNKRLNFKRRELTKSTLASQTSGTNTTACCSDIITTQHPTTMGSLGAKSDSTQATTVAYYLTVPVSQQQQQSNNIVNSSILSSSTLSSAASLPPPLPASQPPTISPIKNSNNTDASTNLVINDDLEANEHNYMLTCPRDLSNLNRAESTASMAYYKIVDGDFSNCNTFNFNHNQHQQNAIANMNMMTSRFYYQLATVPQTQIGNYLLPLNSNTNSKN